MITDECPYCGGQIQSTRKEYMAGLKIELNDEGVFVGVIDDGHWADSHTVSVYCENDHYFMEE